MSRLTMGVVKVKGIPLLMQMFVLLLAWNILGWAYIAVFFVLLNARAIFLGIVGMAIAHSSLSRVEYWYGLVMAKGLMKVILYFLTILGWLPIVTVIGFGMALVIGGAIGGCSGSIIVGVVITCFGEEYFEQNRKPLGGVYMNFNFCKEGLR